MGKLTEKVAKGVFWVLLEKFGIQVAHFVVTLVLARLLTPNDYGTVALLSIFVSLSNILVDSGFGKALIQKKDATQTDYNTVFYISLAISGVLYAVLFVGAPLVSEFYNIPELTSMLRVMALSLIFHAINGVQNVELNRKMKFKLSFRISWVRTFFSSATGVGMALLDYGAWSLVWSSVVGGVVGMIARQLVIAWRPSLTFSWESAKALFRYGWKIVVARIVATLYRDLSVLLIGKFYTRADLAFVKKGSHVPHLLVNSVDRTLARVSFPALVKMQDSPDRLRRAMRRMIRATTFCVFPLMAFCSACAEDIVVVLLGEQWLPTAPYLALWACIWATIPFNTLNVQGMAATGRSGVYLVTVIVRRLIALTVILSTIRYGVLTFVTCIALINAPLGILVNTWPNGRYLGYTIVMQFKDVLPAFLLSLLSASCMYVVEMIHIVPAARLPIACIVGLAVYLVSAILLKLDAVSDMSSALLSGKKKIPPFVADGLQWLACRRRKHR